jgi:S1-C subfamily serine protease
VRTAPFVLLLALLVAGPSVRADDPASALDRLSAEVEALVARADAASGWLKYEGGWLPGAFVGTPARFVVAVSSVPEGAASKVRLPDGSDVEAKRLDADAELGVVVYDVAGAVPAGLAPSPSWDEPRRGTVAVVGGQEPDLAVLRGWTALRGDVEIETGAEGSAVVGSGGRLLALRSNPVASTSNVPILYRYLSNLGSGQGGGVVLSSNGEVVPGLVQVAPPSPLVADSYPTTTYRATRASSVGVDARYVPGPVVARVLEDVASGGRIRRTYLGVVPDDGRRAEGPRPTDVPVLGHLFDARATGTGVRLASVLPDSPAAKAGLEAGATVTAIDGKACPDVATFVRALARRRPGDTVRLTFAKRDAPVSVTLGDRDEAKGRLTTVADLGMEVVPMSTDLARFLGLAPDAVGVVVKSTLGGGVAARAGLAHGDVIFQGEGGPIRDVEELEAVLSSSSGKVRLSVHRAGGPVRVVELDVRPSNLSRKTR